jgi:hypothetical protein
METLITEHAATRVRQRGVDPVVLDCLLAYGTPFHDRRGGEVIVFDRQALRRLQRAVDPAVRRRVEDRRSLYAVRGADGALVTVGHRYRRIPRSPRGRCATGLRTGRSRPQPTLHPKRSLTRLRHRRSKSG